MRTPTPHPNLYARASTPTMATPGTRVLYLHHIADTPLKTRNLGTKVERPTLVRVLLCPTQAEATNAQVREQKLGYSARVAMRGLKAAGAVSKVWVVTVREQKQGRPGIQTPPPNYKLSAEGLPFECPVCGAEKGAFHRSTCAANPRLSPL